MSKAEQLEEFRAAAESVCRLWQEILRLQDWDVEVKVVRHFDLPEDCSGDMGPFSRKKHARMRLLDPRDYNPRWKPDMEPEVTIVHELLHLHFQPLVNRRKKRQRLAEEQAVHPISCALVRAASRR